MPHRREVCQRLQELIDLAAAWVERLDALLPVDDNEATAQWNAPSRGAVEDKILAEASFLLELASRACDADTGTARTVTEACARLMRALGRRARPQRHWQLLTHAPHVAWPVGITHTVLQRRGCRDDTFDELLQACLGLGWNGTVDRLVFHSLEMRWAQALRDGRSPIVEDLLRVAPVSATLPILLARREDAYAFTHTLFYATDFGAHPLPRWIRPRDVSACLDALLAWQLWEDDLDLVGELLIAAWASRAPSRYATTALSVVWDDLRSPLVVRGPLTNFGPDRLATPDDPDVFGRCYHTTFVAGMLCATLLVTQPEMANAPLSDRDRSFVTRQALDALSIVGQRARLYAAWTTRVERVDDVTKNIVGCILDGAMATAYRGGDFSAAAELLGRAHDVTDETTRTMEAVRQMLGLRSTVGELVPGPARLPVRS